MTTVAPPPRRLGATMRRDLWWVQPVLIVTALTLFGIYTLVRVILNKDYVITADGAHLQSPFFSPDLPSDLLVQHEPAVGVPGALGPARAADHAVTTTASRTTARSSWRRPRARSPAWRGASTRARREFPLVLNNLHRIFFYFAAIVVGFLWYDAIRGLFYDGTFGIGLGNGIMFVNVICLSAFTFGCNSWRHIIGGKMNCFSCSASAKTRHGAWQKVSILNGRHMQWAWISMFTVWGADLYIWLVSAGVFNDPHHVF